MEADGAQITTSHQRVPPPWEFLPLEVLGRCLRPGPGAQEHAPFATSKSFARALLASATKKPSLTVKVDDFKPAVARVLQWTADWQVGCGIELKPALPNPAASLQPLLQLLRRECNHLPNVTEMWCEDVLLDACAPAGLNVAFPNLSMLNVRDCRLPSGQLPLAGCSNLQQLVLNATPDWPRHPSAHKRRADWLPQLQQLATLQSLSMLEIDSIHEYPTSFLPLLAGQLTALCLHNYVEPNIRDYEVCGREWGAALKDAAQLTQLHALELSGDSIPVQQLGMLAPFSRLRDLAVGFYASGAETSNRFISTLLQLPQITSLSVGSFEGLHQSYADQPCSWKQLNLRTVSPQVLARLPLHSLTHPLQLDSLILAPTTTAADIQAAVNNLARSAAPTVRHCPGCQWGIAAAHQGNGTAADSNISITFRDRDRQSTAEHPSSREAAAALRAAAPLLPRNITGIHIRHTCMDAELLAALQQLMPPSVTAMYVNECVMARSFWPQLANFFPRLEVLNVSRPVYRTTQLPRCGAADLLGYFSAAAALQRQPGTPPQAACVELYLSTTRAVPIMFPGNLRDIMVQHEIHTQRQEVLIVNEHLRLVGFCTPGGSETTVYVEFPPDPDLY